MCADQTFSGHSGNFCFYCDSYYTEEPPVLSSSPTPEEVEKITRRMYEKSNQHRNLGMMTRKIVQKSFSGDRCLREHEQMLCIGKSMNLMATRPIGDGHETKDVATTGALQADPVNYFNAKIVSTNVT